jgi:hypothetical protein
VYVLAGRGSDLRLYVSDDGGQTFGDAVLVSQGTHAEVLAVVRPALAVDAEGRLTAAWVEFAGAGVARVLAAHSSDGGLTFSAPVAIATTMDPETTMASVAFDAAGQPWVAWLQNSSVRLAAAPGSAAAFGEPRVVDDLVCECCQPAPLAVGEAVFVAYRNLVRDAAGQASRDIHVAASLDGGVTFGAPVRVSDGAWLIDACPIAGPALAERDGRLFVAWMDGRFDDGTFSRTDIWVAGSTDGGASFSPNVRVNDLEGHYNGQPSLVIDPQGRLHVAWAADTDTGQALYYAVSDDGGLTFSSARAVGAGTGRLGSAVLAVSAGGRVLLGWTDAHGAHVMPVD